MIVIPQEYSFQLYRGDSAEEKFLVQDINPEDYTSVLIRIEAKEFVTGKILFAIDILPSDPGNNWAENEVVVNFFPAHTQNIPGESNILIKYDLEVTRVSPSGTKVNTAFFGNIQLIADVTVGNPVILPTTIIEILDKLASTVIPLGSSLIGVSALFWDSITGTPNGTVESVLRFLWNNKINTLISPLGNRLIKTTSSGTTISETGIAVSGENDVSGIRDLTIGRDLFVSGKIVSQGNLIEGDVIQVKDKNIELGKVETPDDDTADGGGFTLLGLTNKTFQWLKAKTSWVSSESIELISGKNFLIDGIEYVLYKLLSFPGSNIPGTVLSTTGSSLEFIVPPTAPVTSVNSKTGEVDLSGDYYDKDQINSIIEDLMPASITTDSVPEGSLNKYYSDGLVKSMVLSGLGSGVNAPISNSDPLLSALAKLQSQINNVNSPLGILDSKWSPRKIILSPSEPWFRKDLDHIFNIENVPLLVPALRNIKWEIGATTVFNVTGFAPGAVTRLQLEDSLTGRNVLRTLLEDYHFSKSYVPSTNADGADSDTEFSAWGFIVRIASDIGTGANAPKIGQEFRIRYNSSLGNTLSVTNRYISIDKDTSSLAVTGTGTIEICPYRIATGGIPNANQARWRKNGEAGLMTPGSTYYAGTDLVEVPPNSRVRDRDQAHLHVYNAYQDGAGGVTGSGSIPYTYSSYYSSNPVSNNTDGTPRNGPGTRGRSVIEYLYGNAVIYIS